MEYDTFLELLDTVAPLITCRDTKTRDAISPGERLAVTLCFLATRSQTGLFDNGENLHDLSLNRVQEHVYIVKVLPCCLSGTAGTMVIS